MNAYLVHIPEIRETWPSYEPLEPPEPYWPSGVYVAETPAQAKSDALRDWTRLSSAGVYSDDWPRLRVRLVERDVEGARRCADDDLDLWERALRIPVYVAGLGSRP